MPIIVNALCSGTHVVRGCDDYRYRSHEIDSFQAYNTVGLTLVFVYLFILMLLFNQVGYVSALMFLTALVASYIIAWLITSLKQQQTSMFICLLR
jgi:inner membrane protein involved in colicin E2 resistance